MNNTEKVIEALQAMVQEIGPVQASRDIGISRQYLYDVLNGRRPVSVRVGVWAGFEWSDGKWKKVKA